MPEPATMTEGHNNGIQRTLGRLEEAVERISDTLEKSDEKSASERQKMNETLDQINHKVDPLTTRLDALEFTVKAHEVTLKSYADREIEFRGAARLGHWLIHAFWLFASLVAIFYSDKIKFPIQKLLALFK